MEADLFKLWKISPADDVDGRERIFYMLRSVELFRNNMSSYMKEGKLAEEELKRITSGRLLDGDNSNNRR